MVDVVIAVSILFSLFIFGALGLRVRYEYLWLRSMGIYVHEYMEVDDEELFCLYF